jgi:hypothetical protein
MWIPNGARLFLNLRELRLGKRVGLGKPIVAAGKVVVFLPVCSGRLDDLKFEGRISIDFAQEFSILTGVQATAGQPRSFWTPADSSDSHETIVFVADYCCSDLRERERG